MSKKTEELLYKRYIIEEQIEKLKSDWRDIERALCEIEGSCPICKNWHYPHCDPN